MRLINGHDTYLFVGFTETNYQKHWPDILNKVPEALNAIQGFVVLGRSIFEHPTLDHNQAMMRFIEEVLRHGGKIIYSRDLWIRDRQASSYQQNHNDIYSSDYLVRTMTQIQAEARQIGAEPSLYIEPHGDQGGGQMNLWLDAQGFGLTPDQMIHARLSTARALSLVTKMYAVHSQLTGHLGKYTHVYEACGGVHFPGFKTYQLKADTFQTLFNPGVIQTPVGVTPHYDAWSSWVTADPASWPNDNPLTIDEVPAVVTAAADHYVFRNIGDVMLWERTDRVAALMAKLGTWGR